MARIIVAILCIAGSIGSIVAIFALLASHTERLVALERCVRAIKQKLEVDCDESEPGESPSNP